MLEGREKIKTPPGKSVSLADFDKENTTPETEPEQDVDDPALKAMPTPTKVQMRKAFSMIRKIYLM